MTSQFLNSDTFKLLSAIIFFIVSLLLVFFLYRKLFRFLKKIVSRTAGKFDDFALELFRIPALWVLFWLLLNIFTHIYLGKLVFYPYLLHVNTLLIIFSVTWIAVQFIKVGAYYLQNKLDITMDDNLSARKNLTLIKVFKAITTSVVIVVAIAVGLLTFDEAKNIGVSLLTSAGILGIIVGFAAQKSIGTILAGIQIAITQPIRFDDVVIVEGEWGRIEEITLTYVVVKIWDERRLILPVTYFLEKPFQNWTRSNANIIGSVFLYLDYSFPVEELRKILPGMLMENSDWDGRVWNIQVTNTTERNKEIRLLLSSSNASKNWDLRTSIREKLIDYINANHPDSFAQIRLKEV